MQIRNFWVDIEDGSGARVGAGPLRAENFRLRQRLSACGDFAFVVSPTDRNFAALALKRIAICRYWDLDGNLQTLGGGVIDGIRASVDAEGRWGLEVTGNDLGRELTYRSVGTLALAAPGGLGVTDGPAQIMALAPAGWSLSGGTTAAPVYVGFDGESVLAALVQLNQHLGEHWRLDAGRVLTWLGPASNFPNSGIRAVQHVNAPVMAEGSAHVAVITSLERQSEAAEVLTRAIPRGSGNGSALVTLAAATDQPPAGYSLSTAENSLRVEAAETLYGRIERALDFKQIGPLSNTTADIQAAANMLLRATAEHLRRYSTPQESYRVELSCNQLLRPGTTLQLIYRQIQDGRVLLDLDGTYNLLEAEQQIDGNGLHTVAVTIGVLDRLPETDANLLASQISASQVLSTHQQLGASADTLTWRDELDNSHGASFRFWLGDEYTSINRALFRFRIQPLRSTVKSVAGSSTTTAGGGAGTETSSAGGGGTRTSASGGGGTQTSSSAGSHAHGITLLPSPPGSAVYVRSGGGNLYNESGIPHSASTDDVGTGHSHSVGIPNHTHTVDTPDHTHDLSLPAHTHDLTPSITTVYGIFEEAAGNTLALSELVIKLNGGGDLRAAVTEIGSGWYALDLTASLVDAVYRPSQENNEVTITSAIAKTARIEAQLTIRGVVQAVNYSV